MNTFQTAKWKKEQRQKQNLVGVFIPLADMKHPRHLVYCLDIKSLGASLLPRLCESCLPHCPQPSFCASFLAHILASPTFVTLLGKQTGKLGLVGVNSELALGRKELLQAVFTGLFCMEMLGIYRKWKNNC